MKGSKKEVIRESIRSCLTVMKSCFDKKKEFLSSYWCEHKETVITRIMSEITFKIGFID